MYSSLSSFFYSSPSCSQRSYSLPKHLSHSTSPNSAKMAFVSLLYFILYNTIQNWSVPFLWFAPTLQWPSRDDSSLQNHLVQIKLFRILKSVESMTLEKKRSCRQRSRRRTTTTYTTRVNSISGLSPLVSHCSDWLRMKTPENLEYWQTSFSQRRDTPSRLLSLETCTTSNGKQIKMTVKGIPTRFCLLNRKEFADHSLNQAITWLQKASNNKDAFAKVDPFFSVFPSSF